MKRILLLLALCAGLSLGPVSASPAFGAPGEYENSETGDTVKQESGETPQVQKKQQAKAQARKAQSPKRQSTNAQIWRAKPAKALAGDVQSQPRNKASGQIWRAKPEKALAGQAKGKKNSGVETVARQTLRMPVDGEISSLFGLRRIPRGRGSRVHKGIDIRAESGTPVMAAAPGTVCFEGTGRGYGKLVEIDHGNGLKTRYAHLDSCSIIEGKRVEAGEVIGTVGRTGHTTGSNLHFETIVDGRYANPMLFFSSGTYVAKASEPKPRAPFKKKRQ